MLLMAKFHLVILFAISLVVDLETVGCLLRRSSDLEYEYKDDVKVKLQTGTRMKRSVDNKFHPSLYDLDLEVDGIERHLRLIRNDDIDTNAPTLTLMDDELTTKHIEEQEASVFYQDVENGASFIVQTTMDNQQNMFGVLQMGENQYILQNKYNITGRSSLVHGINVFEITKESIQHKDYYNDVLLKHNISYRPEEHHRQKRATGSYKIELLIVCDYAIYEYWFDQSPSSVHSEKAAFAQTSVRQYYAFIINGIDAMFKNIQTTAYTISVVFAGIVISETPTSSNWTETKKVTSVTPNTVDSSDALYTFHDWVVDNAGILPNYDHAMLFTRYDLTYDRSTGNTSIVRGLVFVATMCTTFSQSIVKDGFDFIIITAAAHMLGHSLSAKHDGDTNTCLAADAYIMSASISPQQGSTASHPWIFSTCSTDNFTTFLDGLATNCMTALGPSFDTTALYPYDQNMAGQVFDADQQCQHIYGSNSYMCRRQYNNDYASICGTLWCYNTTDTFCSPAIAGEGSTCGNRKWCVNGVCTTSSDAPAGIENCLYGDKRGQIFSNGWTCADMIREGPHNCPIVPTECCASCTQETTTLNMASTQVHTTTQKQTTIQQETTRLLKPTTQVFTQRWTSHSQTTTEPETTTRLQTTQQPIISIPTTTTATQQQTTGHANSTTQVSTQRQTSHSQTTIEAETTTTTRLQATQQQSLSTTTTATQQQTTTQQQTSQPLTITQPEITTLRKTPSEQTVSFPTTIKPETTTQIQTTKNVKRCISL